jgi:hypothetical protein
VFAGLQPAQGPAAVLGVATLLDRLDQLEAGTRPGANAGDKAVLVTLAARQFGPQQRAHLRSLVSIAQRWRRARILWPSNTEQRCSSCALGSKTGRARRGRWPQAARACRGAQLR